jgi:hypothetical protein
MKTKTLFVTVLTLLFVMVSLPIYAGEYHPNAPGIYDFTSTEAGMFMSEREGSIGIVGSETVTDKRGGDTWYEKQLCRYEWENKAFGEKLVVCMHPRHNLGGG